MENVKKMMYYLIKESVRGDIDEWKRVCIKSFRRS